MHGAATDTHYVSKQSSAASTILVAALGMWDAVASPVGMGTSKELDKRAWYLTCANTAIYQNCVRSYNTYCTGGGYLRTDYTAYCGSYCNCEWYGVCMPVEICRGNANATEAATETTTADGAVEKRGAMGREQAD
jgi:hypothetical protein